MGNISDRYGNTVSAFELLVLQMSLKKTQLLPTETFLIKCLF